MLRFFNFFNNCSKVKGKMPEDELEKEFLDRPVLIDDVDTTITSFLKTYGAPVHIDPDDFEDGDDKDFDELDDGDDVDVSMQVDEPFRDKNVEPDEPVKSEPDEPVKSEPAEPVGV